MNSDELDIPRCASCGALGFRLATGGRARCSRCLRVFVVEGAGTPTDGLDSIQFGLAIDGLPLSKRAKNVLKNSNLRSAEDVFSLTRAKILAMPNAGYKTASEILSVLTERRESLSSVQPVHQTSESERPSSADMELLFARLRLSVRAENALRQIIWSSADLTILNEADLRRMKNVGRKTAVEILAALAKMREESWPGIIQIGAAAEVPGDADPLIHTLLTPTPSSDVLKSDLSELGYVCLEDRQSRGQIRVEELAALSISDATKRWHLSEIDWFDIARILRTRGIVFSWRDDPAAECDTSSFVNDELSLILRVIRNPSNRQKVSMRLGWDGGRGATLAEVGQRCAVSRERVRQLEDQVARDPSLRARPWPLLNHALRILAECAPCTADEAELKLQKLRLVRERISVEGLLNAAKLVTNTPDVIFDADTRFLIPTTFKGIAHKVGTLVVKAVRNRGAGTVSGVLEQLGIEKVDAGDGNGVLILLETLRGFSWLDDERTWFWLISDFGDSFNRLLNHVKKVLSVTAPIRIDELYQAVTRNYVLATAGPPRRIFAEICRQCPDLVVSADNVTSRHKLSMETELSRSERLYIEIIGKSGPVLNRPQVEDQLRIAGIEYATASMTIQHSPVVKRFAYNRYGVVGSEPGELGIGKKTAKRAEKSKSHWKWLEGGQLELAVPVDRAIVVNGLVAIPSAVRQFAIGNFTITDMCGRELGLLRCRGRSGAWGLSRVLRNDAMRGSVLYLTFDLIRRNVSADIRD